MVDTNKNIVLINFGPPSSIISARYLSGILKSHGFGTKLVSVSPDNVPGVGQGGYSQYSFSPSTIENILCLSEDALFVGITAFSFHIHLVKEIYNSLSDRQVPLVVGGAHPTVEPNHSSFCSDYVCVGDGEDGIVELACKLQSTRNFDEALELEGCKNIYSSRILRKRTAEEIIGVESNLDSRSFPDYSFGSEYFVTQAKGIEQITKNNAHKYLNQYSTIYSRGCAYNCTFCAQESLSLKSGFSKRVKSKEAEHFIDELRGIRKKFPWAQSVGFFDPNILSNSREDLFEILDEYKKCVDLPLFCSGFTFNQVKEDLFEAFLVAGMRSVIFGVESASMEAKKVLGRIESLEKIHAIDFMVKKLKKKYLFSVQYDLIVDVPWETQKGFVESLRFLTKLKAWDVLDIFSLRYFPGTALFNRALEDGLVDPDNLETEYKRAYRDIECSYSNFLYFLMRDGVLRGENMAKLFTQKISLNLGNLLFKKMGEKIFKLYLVSFGNWGILRKLSYIIRMLKIKSVFESSNILWRRICFIK